MLILGIDPQPKLLALCLINEKLEVKEWYTIPFKKKNTLSAQLWQEHVWGECFNAIQSLKNVYNINLIAIEQQRGRVNSLIESALLGCSMYLQIKRIIYHPKTWKKLIQFKCDPGHKNNKIESVKLVEKKIKTYSEDLYQKNISGLDHLSDAYLIALAALEEYNLKNDI